ncbi:MFS transporter [Komagataeibacter europaeus]
MNNQTPPAQHPTPQATEPLPDMSQIDISPNARKTLWLAAIVAAICGGLYGYDTGIVSGALLLITRDFHLSSFYQEMVASAILAGAVMGSLLTGWMSEHYGRRKSIMIVTAIFVLGALACAFSPACSYPQICCS